MNEQRELKIFPTREKRPMTANGFKDARLVSQWSPDLSESDQWGAPTGEENGFLVVDVDKKSGGLETAAAFNWGDTLKINTPGGGYHVYYKYDKEKDEALRNAANVLPGIDIRNTGGYVVLYGEVDYDRLKPIPDSIRTVLSAKTSRFKSASSLQRQSQNDTTSKDGTKGTQEGGRNAYLTKAAGRMQRLGVLTLSALQEINDNECSPPLDAFEVEQVFNSINRYTPESLPGEDEAPKERIKWAGDMVAGMFEFLRDKGKTSGISTGIPALDTLVGGKRLGELTVTLAEAKSGKNTLWHFQQRDILDRGIAVAYASRELTPETEVLPNLLSLKLGKNIYTNAVTEEEVMDAIKDWKLAFSNGYGAFQGEELWEWLTECIANGVQYFFIDHLHYCLNDAEDYKFLAEFGRKLKTFTKTHQVHVDLIIQPKVRQSYKMGDKMVKQELGINMLRGGASLGQVLDTLITMDRVCSEDGEMTNISRIDVKVARSKMSQTGYFFLAYERKDMSFVECGDPTDAQPEKADNTRANPHRREDAKKPSNYSSKVEGYAESKSGEFFNLKRFVDPIIKAET